MFRLLSAIIREGFQKKHHWLIMAWMCKFSVGKQLLNCMKIINNRSADCVKVGYIWKFVIRMQTNIYRLIPSSFSAVVLCGCLCHHGWVLTRVILNVIQCMLFRVWSIFVPNFTWTAPFVRWIALWNKIQISFITVLLLLLFKRKCSNQNGILLRNLLPYIIIGP
jgi:hypothetical protein